jgi:hypothetical protein
VSRPGSWSKEDYRARCPLHIAWREDEIMCRAAMFESSATVHRYPNEEAANTQKRIYCCGRYEQCEHYRAWKHFIWEDE